MGILIFFFIVKLYFLTFMSEICTVNSLYHAELKCVKMFAMSLRSRDMDKLSFIISNSVLTVS